MILKTKNQLTEIMFSNKLQFERAFSFYLCDAVQIEIVKRVEGRGGGRKKKKICESEICYSVVATIDIT